MSYVPSSLTTALTPQQTRFVEEYLIDPTNQKAAAIRAGYSAANAATIASRLMIKPHIRAAIESAQKKRAESLGVDQDRVLQELILIAFSKPGEALTTDEDGDLTVDLKNMSEAFVKSLGEVSTVLEKGKKKSKVTKFTGIKMADKIAALEKLGKHLGMFKEKVEHSGSLTLEQLVAESMNEGEDNL